MYSPTQRRKPVLVDPRPSSACTSTNRTSNSSPRRKNGCRPAGAALLPVATKWRTAPRRTPTPGATPVPAMPCVSRAAICRCCSGVGRGLRAPPDSGRQLARPPISLAVGRAPQSRGDLSVGAPRRAASFDAWHRALRWWFPRAGQGGTPESAPGGDLTAKLDAWRTSRQTPSRRVLVRVASPRCLTRSRVPPCDS